jgi:Ca-activated chloride channel homolog
MRARVALPLLAASLLLAAPDPGRATEPSVAASQSAPAPAAGKPAPLTEDDQKWLNLVAPIILAPEKKAYAALSQSWEREAFREEFWKRRERDGMKYPLGPGYRGRYEDLRAVAENKYDHWPNDAARMVIRRGEPASIDELQPCRRTFRDLEIWTYNDPGSTGGRGQRYFFYRRTPADARKLWTIGTPDADVFQPGSCRKSFEELTRECAPQPPGSEDNCALASKQGAQTGFSGTVCGEVCDVVQTWTEITARQGSRSGGAVEEASLLEPEPISLEGLDAIRTRSASASEGQAKPLSATGPSGAADPSTTAGGTVAASQGSPAPPGDKPALPAAKASVQDAKPPKPTTEKEKIAALPDEQRQWLEFVAPIILPEEKKAFLELTQAHEWEAFQNEFWKRRERPDQKPPLGPGYRYRYEELRRLADSQYDHWPNDAAAMVIRRGEPESINRLDACNDMGVGAIFRDLEIWTYSGSTAAGGGRRYFFYRRSKGEARRLWTFGTPDSDVFNPRACYPSFESLSAACTREAKSCGCMEACDVYRIWNEIRGRQGSRAGAEMERAQLMTPEPVSLEGIDAIKNRSANVSDPNASKLTVEGPSSAAPAAAGPAPTRRKLSKKEIRERTEAEPAKYRDFLELVDLIITDDEREVFLQITDPLQKDRFIETFWRRRSTDPRGLRTDYKAMYIQRYQLALEQFRNMHSDRAKIFLVNGPPDALINIDCVDVYVPIQIWYYERIEALKSKVYLLFYKKMGIGPEYSLWLPVDGVSVLVGNGMSSVGPGARRVDVTQCPEWRTVNQAMQYTSAVLGSGAMSMAGASILFQPPTVETEGVDQILSMTTDMAANAVTLGVAKLIRFPDQRANKIGVDLSVLVPRAELKSRQLGEEVFYNVDVIGEVAKDDRLIDNFKYRFDIPTEEVGGEKIPLTMRRYLYPGEYKLILKVSDSNQNAEARMTEALKVPEQPDAPPPIEAAARAQGRATLAKAQETTLLPSAISLIPIAKEIATGLQRFETKAAEGVTAVDFFLNGTKVMTRTRAPFDADLNLGPLPRKHVVRVVAYGPSGRAVGEDEYIVNEGREVFRVRILTPEKGVKASGPTPVVAAVAVPEGRALQKVEFYSNETRVATLYQAPWEQTINLKATQSLGYVRVVGTLEDGTVAEDVRYVNAPSYISEVSVDAVELYTAVTEKGGRPVSGLQQTNFKVYEDGVMQKIESFEYVKNVPISIGVLVDTSASMLEALPEAQKAAMGFLDYSIGPRDRGFTISFDNEPYILSKLTNRKDRLYRSLAGLRAEGSTALYDAIVYGLYQFTGVKGKKALVILSDGKDTSSKFDYDTLLDYVKKSGIAIYAIGLKIPNAELDVKYKLNKLAQVTGGQTFMIDSVKNLESVYRQINDELRSQYLLTYYSTNAEGKDKWRKVEVKVEPTNLVARTLSGYYP